MNQRFLTGWHVRTLDSGLMEASASWRIEALRRFDNIPTPRVETKEERDITLAAICATLDSLRAKAPYCLAIIGLGAMWIFPLESKEALDSAPREDLDIEWLPGDEDFSTGKNLHSTIVNLGKADVAPICPIFLGMDPRCLALFSQEPIILRDVVARLARQKGHPEALEMIIDRGVIAAYPALDGDVIIFVTKDEEMLSYIIASENGKEI